MSDLPDNDALEAAIAQWVLTATGLPVGQAVWSSGKPRPAGTYVQLSIPVDNDLDWGEDASEWNPLVVPDQTIASISGNQLAVPAHPYQNADGPFRIVGGTAPLPVTGSTNVWLIVDDAGHVRLASSYLNARHSTPITLTNAGSGTMVLHASAATLRTGQEVIHHSRTLHKLTVRCVCFSTVTTGSGTARSVLRRLITRGALPTVWKVLTDAGLGWAGHSGIQTIDGVAGNSPASMAFEPRAIVSIDMFYRGDVSEYGQIIQSADITITPPGHTFHVPKS